MSGFGIRAFKKKVDHDIKDERDSFIKYIVYGENTYAVLTFLRLFKKFPGEVKLIAKKPFFKEDMLKEWDCTIGSVRSEEVANALMGLNARFEIYPEHKDVFFYKDAKFHSFTGRAKSHTLKEEEIFFTEPSYHINLASMFSEEDFENLDVILKDHEINKYISKIEVLTPDDLVEPSHFKLHTGENEAIRCEQIYFCESPRKFLNLVSNRSDLPDAVYSFAAGISNEQAISLCIKCHGSVSEQVGTFILPQSMTHEWGSFIVDVKEYDHELDIQELTCLSFISENDLQEEDLAKKIKLLKRVVERVFPDLAKLSYAQDIKFTDEYLQTGTNDAHFKDLEKQPVKFFGQASAINHPSSEKFRYYSRGIYAILNAIEL